MSQISSVDYNNKRAYLHLDTVANGFDAIIAHFEIKVLASNQVANGQFRYPPSEAVGNVRKTTSTLSPRYAYLEPGWRFIPYGGVTHILRLLCEIVSKDQLVDADVFDFSSLGVNVHIVSEYESIEIREIATGASVLTEEQNQLLIDAASASDVYASIFIK